VRSQPTLIWPLYVLGLCMVLALPIRAAEPYELSETQQRTAKQLMQDALKSDLAWQILESLTTEVGPRLGGSEAELRARIWGKTWGEKLSFDRVVIEPFKMPFWGRGHLSIAMTQPYQQALYGTALGGSAPSIEDIDGDIVYFRSFHDIEKVIADELNGKIAFVDGELMVKSQTGAGYSSANMKRRVGWQHAERGGAEALVIRSVGSDSHRFPHTGMMSNKEGTWPKIPVIAISNPDADHLRRLHQRNATIELTLSSGGGWQGEVQSGNVVMDLLGREKPEEIIVIGGHLDSWDLGTGAVDDGAGVAITTAAAELIAQLPQRPRRTIRVIMWGAEEVGLLGARAYASRHKDNLHNHVLASESDFGADTVWSLDSNVNEQARSAMDAIGRLIEPLGVVRGRTGNPNGGPDVIPLVALNVPTFRLNQNGRDYFDLHHTPDDTLDKINPEKLAQNVAAWAATVYLAAELDVDFRLPAKETTVTP